MHLHQPRPAPGGSGRLSLIPWPVLTVWGRWSALEVDSNARV